MRRFLTLCINILFILYVMLGFFVDDFLSDSIFYDIYYSDSIRHFLIVPALLNIYYVCVSNYDSNNLFSLVWKRKKLEEQERILRLSDKK